MIRLTRSRELARELEVACPVAGFSGNTVVVKCGGAAMERSHLRTGFSRDVAALQAAGMRPLVVHGEARQITPSEIHRDLLRLLVQHGVSATDVTGGRLSPTSEPVNQSAVNTSHLRALQARGVVPVVGPVGPGADHRTCHIDADLVAGEIAAALGAALLIYLTDAVGILDRAGCRFRRLSRWAADSLVRAGMIDDGMLPKIEGAVRALKGGAAQARIIDGRVPHALALALRAPHGMMGTEIVL
jgi:acetylglutamate kinase